MSREARDWAWQQVPYLTLGQALVLLYVAERADPIGCCYPHARTIAAAVPLTEGSTSQRLKELARKGFLTRQRVRRRNGSFTGRWLIQLSMPSGPQSQVEGHLPSGLQSQVEGRHITERPPDSPVPAQLTGESSPADGGVPPYVEPSVEPSIEP
jgi:hypothetical protein